MGDARFAEGSSAAPALYQSMWVTMGARWSWITTISSPFSRVYWVMRSFRVVAGCEWAVVVNNRARVKRSIRMVGLGVVRVKDRGI